MAGPVRVLIVDDSSLVRQMLSRALADNKQIQVVGTAPDPYVARDMIVQLNPDVLTLDVEMPRMDGISFLRKLMQYHPMPVIIFSSLTAAGTQTAIEALSAGAVEVLAKPGESYSVGQMGPILAERIIAAAACRPGSVATQAPAAPSAIAGGYDKIIALGASTGGVQALTAVLTQFPADAPATLVVQHMPTKFTASFAQRLDGLCRVRVREAQEGDELLPGRVLLAPGGFHMCLMRANRVSVRQGPAVHHQMPSVEVLMHSVAKAAGARAVGAILTGMGADGALGLLAMRQAGARTIAQDQSTSVVYGMPMEAMKCGAAERAVPLSQIAATVLRLAKPVA